MMLVTDFPVRLSVTHHKIRACAGTGATDACTGHRSSNGAIGHLGSILPSILLHFDASVRCGNIRAGHVLMQGRADPVQDSDQG